MVQFSITEVRDTDNIPLEQIPRITITNSEGEVKPKDEDDDDDDDSGLWIIYLYQFLSKVSLSACLFVLLTSTERLCAMVCWTVMIECISDWWSGSHGFDPEIDYEIFSTVILSLPLIQEGHLSFSGKRICTSMARKGGGQVWQRCRVSCVTRASNWHWLTFGQGQRSCSR